MASVSVTVPKRHFAIGEDIVVTVLLEAGPKGVYVPKSWGDNPTGKSPGFVLRLGTPVNQAWDWKPCSGTPDPIPSESESDANLTLERRFVFLGPGQIIGLRTNLAACVANRRGDYVILATYLPYHVDLDHMAPLPQTRGLLLQKPIEAKPISISVR